MRLAKLVATLNLIVTSAWSSAAAQGIGIDHDAVGCVQVGKFPQFFARFDPKDQVSRARLHFRPADWPHWYSVPMYREGPGFAGSLPKPEKSLKRMEYYISVLDRSFAEARTPEYAPDVVSGPGACGQKKLVATALGKAKSVIVNGPEGVANAPKVPTGFSSDGVIAGSPGTSSPASTATPVSPAPTGAAAGAGAAAASGPSAGAGAAHAGGFGSKGLLIIGGVAAAGAGVALAVSGGGGDTTGPAAPNCANLAPGLSTLTVTVAQPTGTPQFNWTPACPVASLLVETPDGGDFWSTAGNLLPPVTYSGPGLASGVTYRVILFNANDEPLGTQTFTP